MMWEPHSTKNHGHLTRIAEVEFWGPQMVLGYPISCLHVSHEPLGDMLSKLRVRVLVHARRWYQVFTLFGSRLQKLSFGVPIWVLGYPKWFWGTPLAFRFVLTNRWTNRLANLGLGSWHMPAGGIKFWWRSHHNCRSWVLGVPKSFGVPQTIWGTPLAVCFVLANGLEICLANLGLGSWYMPAGGIKFWWHLHDDCRSWVLGVPNQFWGPQMGFLSGHLQKRSDPSFRVPSRA